MPEVFLRSECGAAEELIKSAIHAALLAPTVAVAQIADHAFGTKGAKSVENFFNEHGLDQPAPVSFGSANWHARTIGGAIGMLLPFAATKSCIGKMAAKANALNGGPAFGRLLLEGRHSASFLTGIAMGLVLTPSAEGKNFWKERIANGAESGATFATLSASSAYLSRFAALKSPIVSGALSGLPAGLVASEIGALRDHRLLPGGRDVAEAMYGMAIVGGAFGAKDQLSKRGSLGEDAARKPIPKIESYSPAGKQTYWVPMERWSAPDSVTEAQKYERSSVSEYASKLDLRKRFPTLEGTRTTDVAIIGGGFGGMVLADYLGPNIDTMLIEGSRIGGATSSKPAAMVTRVPDLEYTPIFERYGEQQFGRIIKDMNAAHNDVISIAKRLDTDFKEHNSAKVSYEANDEGLAKEFEVIHPFDTQTALVGPSDAASIFAPAKSALVFNGEGSLNPRKFVVEMAQQGNSMIFEDSPVRAIRIGGDGEPVEIHTDHGVVRANKLVFATGGLVPPFEYLYKYLDPIQCFAGTACVKGSPVKGNVFDNLEPDFNYFRMLEENKMLFGGAAKFLSSEQAAGAQPKLTESLQSLFPGAHFERQWNGTIFSTVTDGLPIIERHPQYPQLFSITGLGGIGLVNAALTARTLKSMLGNNAAENFYDTRRLQE